MTGAIIGGAIAAVIGVVSGAIISLLLEHRREKVQRLAIVDALIIETEENLTICKSSDIREFWWRAPHKLEAYQSYKGQLWFLPEDVLAELIDATLNMKGRNIDIQTYLSRVVFEQPADAKPVLPSQDLIEQLKFVHEDLQKWRDEHSHCRLFNLVSAVCRRLRNFISTKIRKNSKLNHT